MWKAAAHLPDVRALGLSGPGYDARDGQPGLTGIDEVRGVHLHGQGLDVL